MGDWSQLPLDLLHQITDQLTLPDLIRFGYVCSPWRSVSAPARHKGSLPWLILPLQNNPAETENHVYEDPLGDEKHDDTWMDSLGFFSVLDGKSHRMDIPELNGRRICGSSNGWLITIHQNSDVNLIHPFSRKVIDLPSLTNFPEVHGIKFLGGELHYVVSQNHLYPSRHNTVLENARYVRDFLIFKAIVSLNSNSNQVGASFVVMGIVRRGRRLFCYRPMMGDSSWKIIQNNIPYVDVTYYKGQFYALNSSGSIFVVEGIDSPKPFTRCFIQGTESAVGLRPMYLVVSSGELLVVLIQNDKPSELLVRVFKIDIQKAQWLLEVQNIGDHALFLGSSHSASISTTEFPGCKRNCIYFSGPSLTGIYNLGDCTFETIHSGDSELIPLQSIWYASMLGHC